MPLPRRAVIAAVLTSLVTVLASCTSSSTGSGPSSEPGSASSAQPSGSSAPKSSQPRLASAKQIYVSVGDSYAAGYQPAGRGRGATTGNGYSDQTVTLAKGKGYDLTLANFGCSGATTTSALTAPGCAERNRAVGAPAYTEPQVAAAVAYLKTHRNEVGLVTVALGGNDITPCADSSTTSAATTCVATALSKITANITTTVTQLRAAAGPATRIVGITYPDVFLGEALSDDAAQQQFANLSVFAFRTLINPALKDAYAKGGASFADVTAATGAYTPLTQTTGVPQYGTIPVAVAKICQLTYFCQFRDIHPRTSGHQIIAGLIVKALPAR